MSHCRCDTALLSGNLLGEQIVLQWLSGVQCKMQAMAKLIWLMPLTSGTSQCCSYTAIEIRVNLNLA